MAKSAVRYSPAAMMTRGALLTYLQPRLAMDQRPNTMKIVDKATQGVTGQNFRKLAPAMMRALQRSCQGRLAQDGLGIDDLAQMLSALAPQAEQADQAPGLGQIATNPGGSAGPMTVSGGGGGASPDNGPAGGGESSDIIAKIKAYLEQEGVAPEILNNLDAFLAEHQPAAPAPPAPGAPPAPPAGGPGGPGGPDQGMGAGRDQGAPVGLGGGPVGGMSTGGMGPGGGLDENAPPAEDQEGTEGLVEGGNNGGAWADLDPRGGTENDLKPESAEDSSMDNLPEAFREHMKDGEDEEAEDELVPGEQDEQTEGVPEVSSKGTMSRYVGGRGNGGGGEDRAITKSAMDKAIRVAQDAAIQNQRNIRQAERYVRQWVGDMAFDSARDHFDVYRATLQALDVKGIDKVHRDALRPILEAQPKLGQRQMQQRQMRIAADSAPGQAGGSFLERFPDAAKITIQ